MEGLILLWLAAFPLMGSPGPATLSIAGVGTAYGFRAGVPYLFGIIGGTTVVLLLIATGVTALILASPILVTGLTILAAIYIVYLAVRIATAPIGVQATGTDTVPRFWPGLVLAAANPKAFAAIGAVFASQTLIQQSATQDAAAKVIALVFVIVCVNTIWLALGAVLSRSLSHPKLGRIANIIFALMLIASVVVAMISI